MRQCVKCGKEINAYSTYAGGICKECYHKDHDHLGKEPEGVYVSRDPGFQVQKITGPYPYRSFSMGANPSGVEVRDPHHRKILEKQHGITSDVDLKFATGGRFSTRRQMREYVLENQPRRKHEKEQN